jgi:hypothetical protein
VGGVEKRGDGGKTVKSGRIVQIMVSSRDWQGQEAEEHKQILFAK